jgi:threonine/homoserine/homoserine lactone efflux protein
MADFSAPEAMLTFLVLGAGIGFVAGVSPGPVLTLVVTETLKSGWLRGAAVAAGPLLAGGPIVLIAVTMFDDLPPAVLPAISVVGGVFLIYLAVTNVIGARHTTLPRREVHGRARLLAAELFAHGMAELFGDDTARWQMLSMIDSTHE